MFLKSIYVMVYIMGANAIAAWSVYQLYTGGIGFGWAGVLLAWLQNSQQGALPLILGITGVLGWSLYLFWYSRYGGREGTELRIGNPLPEFILQDEQGNKVNSRQFLGNPALLLFYRGNWCPLCMAQSRKSPLNTSN